MISETTDQFWKVFWALPEEVQNQAKASYKMFRLDPRTPSLRFKCVVPSTKIYSVRITRSYRALGVLNGEKITWFWIGGHDEYERLIQASL